MGTRAVQLKKSTKKSRYFILHQWGYTGKKTYF